MTVRRRFGDQFDADAAPAPVRLSTMNGCLKTEPRVQGKRPRSYIDATACAHVDDDAYPAAAGRLREGWRRRADQRNQQHGH